MCVTCKTTYLYTGSCSVLSQSGRLHMKLLHTFSSLLQLRQLLRKGIPTELRSEVWQLFLNSHTLKAQSSFDYQVQLM